MHGAPLCELPERRTRSLQSSGCRAELFAIFSKIYFHPKRVFLQTKPWGNPNHFEINGKTGLTSLD
jgi:hypothetical protein